MWSTVLGVVGGGVAGLRAGGPVGAILGAGAGYVVVPRVATFWGWDYAPAVALADTSAVGQNSPAVASALHIGAAVRRPSVAAAVALLRPTLALYGSSALASAALANAYAESRFDALAGGDVDAAGTPQAVGLFQLHSRGAGKGMTVADRVDPVRATRRILETAAAAGLPGAAPSSLNGFDFLGILSAVGVETDPGELAALTARFTIEVERPANANLRATERVASLRTDGYLRQVLTGLGLPVL